MTRDEAYTLTCKAWVINDYTRSAEIGPCELLDAFVALGMLKLDEPRTKSERIGKLMEHFGITCYSPIEFENWARAVGLVITEK